MSLAPYVRRDVHRADLQVGQTVLELGGVCQCGRKGPEQGGWRGKQLTTNSLRVAQIRSGETIDDWLVRVDQALYSAKEHGRNCVMGRSS